MAEGAVARWFNARSAWQCIAFLAALGAGTSLGQAPFSLPIFTLVGLVVAFVIFPALKSHREAIAAGLAFGTGYFALSLHWIVEPFLVDVARHGWMAPFALVFLSVGLALFWGAAFAVARWMAIGRWALVLTLTGAEMLRAYVFTGFPWAMLSYGLVDGLAGQAASFVGPHGLTLILLVSAAGISGFRARKTSAVVGILFAVVALWPMPEANVPNPERPMVRLVQPNAPQHQKWDPEFMRVFFDRALRATRSGLEVPDLIVWPETSVPSPLNNSINTRAAIAKAARGAPVVLGLNRYDGLRFYNSAVVIGDEGAIGDVYDKHHLVPFGEYVPFGDVLARFGIHGLAAREGGGYSAGPGPHLMDVGAVGRALPLICYEAVFPQDTRGTDERPDLLMQITNDAWFGAFSGPYQHLQQARMRAIEQGLPLVRAANTGISAVVDARGRVTAQLGLGKEGFLDARLPQALSATVYSRTADLPLSLMLFALIAGFGLRKIRETD
ncbi:Apolipoprotein N-acyltransferase [Shimia gijangensis]|uniref:Apolipoprotein N-acyltransferase n=1 Tax=Shimia gijangensis TaxID=1470563 RepID=A0A1M6IK32_9RHOB|nr:apolipoprotein N-acyltransferase [Shimia gijangensis]SHJ34836.1 Apolipoprotein N-acyltransferase [Shimia gijangensis]